MWRNDHCQCKHCPAWLKTPHEFDVDMCKTCETLKINESSRVKG